MQRRTMLRKIYSSFLRNESKLKLFESIGNFLRMRSFQMIFFCSQKAIFLKRFLKRYSLKFATFLCKKIAYLLKTNDWSHNIATKYWMTSSQKNISKRNSFQRFLKIVRLRKIDYPPAAPNQALKLFPMARAIFGANVFSWRGKLKPIKE